MGRGEANVSGGLGEHTTNKQSADLRPAVAISMHAYVIRVLCIGLFPVESECVYIMNECTPAVCIVFTISQPLQMNTGKLCCFA